jgi:signal transduction histidine kinase
LRRSQPIHGKRVTPSEPQAAQLPGEKSNRAPRLASLGLAAVVACLAAFSIFAAYTTQEQVDRAEQLDSQRKAYSRAATAMRTAVTAELEFVVEQTPDRQKDLDATNEAVIVAVYEATYGDGQSAADGGAFAREMLALHDRHVAATARFVAALATGDAAEAHRIDVEELDPILQVMLQRLDAAADERGIEVDSGFATLRSTSQAVLILAPAIFAIGFALMLMLWRILEGYHRATRKTYREIEQLSKLRSEFVSIVSHEFRTPLTGIQGFSEMLRDDDLTMPEMREYAEDINKDARRLARLITDMLDLDRMESGRMMLNSEPVDLNQIVTETAAQFRLGAADHPIELDLDSGLHGLVGDADRLTQVVTNLLSNAIKYSPSGGAVEVRTERSDGTVTLTVADHGMGIPTEQLEKIFDRYSRVETVETRNIQGTGLGLPIVRQIVQLCEGKVWATSEAGRGSVFHVQLPLADIAARPGAV